MKKYLFIQKLQPIYYHRDQFSLAFFSLNNYYTIQFSTGRSSLRNSLFSPENHWTQLLLSLKCYFHQINKLRATSQNQTNSLRTNVKHRKRHPARLASVAGSPPVIFELLKFTCNSSYVMTSPRILASLGFKSLK